MERFDNETVITNTNSKEKIYHYTSTNGLLGIIKEKNLKFWFSHADYMNDISEGSDVIAIYKQTCCKLFENYKISREFYQDIYSINPEQTILIKNKDGTYSSQACDIYMCCFSTEKDSLPMWNYYVKGTKCEGYNIGLWAAPFISDRKIELRKVIYSDSYKSKEIEQFLLEISHFYEEGNKKDVKKHIQIMLTMWQYAFKNHHFEHEREVRAVLKIEKGGSDEYPVKFRESNGILIPYIEYNCESFLLDSVTIGPLLNAKLAQKSIASYLCHCGYSAMKDKIISSDVPIRY